MKRHDNCLGLMTTTNRKESKGTCVLMILAGLNYIGWTSTSQLHEKLKTLISDSKEQKQKVQLRVNRSWPSLANRIVKLQTIQPSRASSYFEQFYTFGLSLDNGITWREKNSTSTNENGHASSLCEAMCFLGIQFCSFSTFYPVSMPTAAYPEALHPNIFNLLAVVTTNDACRRRGSARSWGDAGDGSEILFLRLGELYF